MSLSWRDVDMANQSTANNLLQSGQKTIMDSLLGLSNTFANRQKRLDEQQTKDQIDQLGVLGLRAARDNATALGSNILDDALKNGLKGEQALKLAEIIQNQGQENINNNLNQAKLDTDQQQFMDNLNLNRDKLNQAASVDKANQDLALKQFGLKEGDTNFDQAMRKREFGLKQQQANKKDAPKGDDIAQASVYQLVNSPEFAAMDQNTQRQALAGYGKAGKDAIDILGYDNKEGSSKSGSKPKADMGVVDTLFKGDVPVAPEDQVRVKAMANEAKDRGIPPETFAAYMGKQIGYRWYQMGRTNGGNQWGDAEVPSTVDYEEIKKWASNNNMPLNTPYIDPQDQAQVRKILGK